MKTEIITQGFQDKKTLFDKDRLCEKIVENVKNFFVQKQDSYGQ